MDGCVVDIGGCFPVGKKTKLRGDFSGDLSDGVLLSGTPQVTEEGGSTVSIGTPTVNTGSVTIGNVTLVAGQAIIVPITVLKSSSKKTVLRIACGTTDPHQNVVQRIQFRTS